MNTNLLLSFLVIFRTFSADMLSLLDKYNNDVFDNIIFIKDFFDIFSKCPCGIFVWSECVVN